MRRKCSFAGHNPRKTLKVLLLVLVLVLAIRNWVWMPALIVGESMAPTLHDGQWVIVNKLAYRFRPPARSEIVCIWTGTDYMTKRVIGLPGEEVAMHAGKLQVNGRLCLEPYVEDPANLEILPGKIPANSFAVIGDRRSGTIVAVVNRRRILGKVVCAKLACHWRTGNGLPAESFTGVGPRQLRRLYLWANTLNKCRISASTASPESTVLAISLRSNSRYRCRNRCTATRTPLSLRCNVRASSA